MRQTLPESRGVMASLFPWGESARRECVAAESLGQQPAQAAYRTWDPVAANARPL
jgi:hypothetical protein